MSDLDNAYLSGMRRVQDMRDEEEWQRMLGNPPAPPDEKNVAEKFLGGVTKGMQSVPNVFRPAEQQPDVVARVGEALALPFTIPYEGLMGGLVESGAITPETKKHLTDALMGAIPAMMGPKGATAKGVKEGAKLATEGGAPGHVRIVPEGTPEAVPEVRVNLKRINAGKEVKTVIANVNRLNGERLAEHRKPQSHEVLVAKSQRISVEDALALPEDTAVLPETALKLRDVATAAATDLTDVAKAAAKGDEKAAAQIFDSLAVAGEVEARSEMAKRNVARALEGMKEEAEASRGGYDQAALIDLATRYASAEEADPVVLANRLLELKTQERRMSFARQIRTFARTGSDMLHTLYVNMLLTPGSHAANLVGNELLKSWDIGERFIAGAVRPLTGGDITLTEAVGLVRSIPESFVDGLRAVKEYGWMNPAERTKADVALKEGYITSANLGIDQTFFGKMFDYLWTGATMNTRLLGAEDAFAKGSVFHSEAKALAIREAMAEELTGQAFRDRVQYIESHIEEFPTIVESANKHKLVMTLQDEMGPVAEVINSARHKIPGFRYIVPFLRTPSRLAYWASSRIPGLNLPYVINGKLGQDLYVGGSARQLAVAKIVSGAAATSAIAYYAANGFITGGGPKDKSLLSMKKATGWIPYSIKVGDTYYGYNRLDPVGLMMGAIADFTEMSGHIPDNDADAIGLAFAVAFANNFVSKTYLQGVSGIFETIADPSANAHAYAKNFVRGLIPGAVRSAERAIDPTLREANTLLEAMQAQVPGWSSDLPPQRNLFGEPVLSPPGFGPDWISPVSVGVPKHDPVADEIVRVGVSLTMPPRAIWGTKPPLIQMEAPKASQGEPLTPKEYDWFVRLAGNELKSNGKGMKDSLSDLFKTDAYKRQSDGPDGGKAYAIRQVVMKYREAARMQLLEDAPDLRSAIEDRIRLRAEKLQPVR